MKMSKKEPVERYFARATRASKSNDWITTVEQLYAVLTRFPGNRRATEMLRSIPSAAINELLTAAQNSKMAREPALAERALAAAFFLAPRDTQIGLALARIQLDMGRAPRAANTAKLILEVDVQCVDALNVKGRALREMGRNEDAKACFFQALSCDKTNAQSLNNLGISARAEGDEGTAKSFYRKALLLQPDNIILHRNLSHVTKYKGDHAHIEQMQALLEGNLVDGLQAAPLHFALFKALNDVGRKSEAFSHLEKGNHLAKAANRYDFQNDVIPYALTKKIFNRVPESPKFKPISFRPIYITGLPRSGTTLIERILSRSNCVQACGELTVVQIAVSRLLRKVLDREDKRLTKSDIELLREDILEGLAEYSDGCPVLIDKMPLNFRWIGYICAALPEAKVVHVSRVPMAVAWSTYRLDFDGPGNGYAYDVDDIAKFMVLHRNYMAHWRELYPNRIFDMEYEQLVGDTKSVTTSLAAFTELTWTPDWLLPEKAQGQVLTASADQVRKPIYHNGNDAWRKYEDNLTPMSEALQRVGMT